MKSRLRLVSFRILDRRNTSLSIPRRAYAATRSEADSAQLTTLRRAIANQDVDAAEHELQDIFSSSRSNLLGVRDLKDISNLLQRSQQSRHAHTQSTRTDEVLVHLATRGHVEALNTCLVSALESGDSARAFELWQKFMQAFGVSGADQTTQPAPSSSSSSSLPSPSTVRPRPDRLEDTLALGVAACVIHEKRTELLQAIFGPMSSIPLNQAKIPQSILTGPHAKRIHQYVEDIRLAKMLEHPRGILGHFASTFQGGDVDGAVQTMRHIVSGIKTGWISPINSPKWREREGVVVTMTEPIWSAVIGGFMRANRPDLARALWEQMDQLAIKKTAVTWNALLEGYVRRGHYDELAKIWEAMETSGVEKDVFSYTTAISGFFQAKHSDYALNLWNEMRRKITVGELNPAPGSRRDAARTAEGEPNPLIVPYNAVLHGLLISARSDQALALFEDMRISGPPPDITTVNTLIRHYSRKGDMTSIAALLRRLPELRVQPDIFTFTSVLHACLRCGVATREAVRRVESAMQASGITPNVVMYSAIIDQTVRQGGRDNIAAGFDWLDAMERRGLKPNEVTFTALLAALQKDQSLPREYVKQKTAEINERMSKDGARRNRVTYNVLIKASLARSDEDGLVDAIGHYRQMVKDGIKANDDTWYLLLQGALSRNALSEGLELLAEMSASGFVPTGSLAAVANRIRTRADAHM